MDLSMELFSEWKILDRTFVQHDRYGMSELNFLYPYNSAQKTDNNVCNWNF